MRKEVMRENIIEINYKPQKHQLLWHKNPTRFLIAVCGRQIGKTTAAVNELIMRAASNPETRNWYVTNDFQQARRNVWSEIKKYIPKEVSVKYNESDMTIKFPNGSTIELIGVENAERLRGAVVHFMILDEYADFSRNVWEEILSPMFTTTNGQAWFIGTPKGLGNDFYDKYMSAPDDKEFTRYKIPAISWVEKKGTKVMVPTSEYAAVNVIKHAFEVDDPDSFNQEYMGDFTRPRGTVYKEWPIENFKKVPYDVNLPLHLSIDFGVNDPTAIIWIQPNGSEYRVIDYYEGTDAEISHYIQAIRSKPYKTPELITGDPAGKARNLTTGTSPIEMMAKKGLHVRVKYGVKLLDQIRITHEIMKSLYVDKRLDRFKDCILNYRYPSNREKRSKIDTSVEIPIHNEYSHAMRALEYYAVNVKDFSSDTVPISIGKTQGLGGVEIERFTF